MPAPADPPGASLADRLLQPRALLGVAAALATAVWVLAYRYYASYGPIHAHDPPGVTRFGVDEAPFLIAAAVVEVFVCAALTATLSARWPRALDAAWSDLRARPDRAYVAFACVAGALSLGVGLGLLGGHPITEDEKTYLFQAHLLLEGRLSTPVPREAAAFWQPFIVSLPGRWSAQYPWGHSALLAPALLLGVPGIVTAAEAAVTVHFTGKLAGEYTKDPRVGILAAALAALSPIVVLTGGTLHNANLAAACAAVSLWAMVRLAERPGLSSWIALGVATGLGLHDRLLDQAAIVAGGGILLLHHHRRDVRGFARAVGPAVLVSLPLLALHPILNHLAFGRWSTTGYAAFNGDHGWTTMGFGVGPFGQAHTPAVAAAKSFAALVRIAFYATGFPFALALAAVPAFGLRRWSAKEAAPLVVVLVYGAGYFLYAAGSIDPTGPVYYLALMPVLLGWVAMGAVEIHDALSAHPGLRRAVPAFLAAQAIAAAIVLWPPQIAYLIEDVRQASACEALVEGAGVKRGLVFVLPRPAGTPMPANVSTWEQWPPLSLPPFDAPVLYARSLGLPTDTRVSRRMAGDRPLYLERCTQGARPGIVRYDPARGTIAELDGSGETRLDAPAKPAPPTPQRDAGP